MLHTPRLLELIEQCRVEGTQERNIQGSDYFLPPWGWPRAHSCVAYVLPSTVTDLLPTKEWTVPTPWKSPEFSWPGLGAHGDGVRLTEGPMPGAQASVGGGVLPFAHSGLGCSACGMSPGATRPAACLQGV